ncbi:MAG TPA: hypothetical protein VGM81_01205 [Burkholderiaceae bacterium]|jgi:hypothetical protein
MANTYYVRAKPDSSGAFAICTYYADIDANEEASQPLRVPTTANACMIGQARGSDLLLIGSVFKTLGNPAGLNNSNYSPADDNGYITVSMPTDATVTKGVVLLFADSETVKTIYPSEDPEVTNQPG